MSHQITDLSQNNPEVSGTGLVRARHSVPLSQCPMSQNTWDNTGTNGTGQLGPLRGRSSHPICSGGAHDR